MILVYLFAFDSLVILNFIKLFIQICFWKISGT